MKILDKMKSKLEDNGLGGVTIAFLGDSVTQGCFEIYRKDEKITPVFDQNSSYERFVFDILSMLYPSCTLNIINAGISGDNAPGGFRRVERDVIRHAPDLCVVCYGLNDCSNETESVERYVENLSGIFEKLSSSGIEIIFMTPNMMNTTVSDALTDEGFRQIAERTGEMQNSGVFDAHIEAARELCRKMDIALCDCYAIWKRLDVCGVDTTELLSNRINHPTREMNRLFAYELVKTMLEI